MKQNTKAHEEVQHTGSNVASVVAGVVIGGIAGAGAALLFAPQSGRETREQIQQKTIELRDQAAEKVEGAVADVKAKTMELRDRATEKVEGTVSDVKAKTNKLTEDVHHKVENMQHRGQEVIAQKLDQVAEAAIAGSDAIAPEPETPGRNNSPR